LSISDGNTIELAGIHDEAYVDVSGDAMNGSLQITTPRSSETASLVLQTQSRSTPGVSIDSAGDGMTIDAIDDGINVVAGNGTGVRAVANGGSSAFFGETTRNSTVTARFQSRGLGSQTLLSIAFGETGSGIGIVGQSQADSGIGIFGRAASNSGDAIGVLGRTSSPDGAAIVAEVTSSVSEGDSTALIARHFGDTGAIARFQNGFSNVFVIRKNGNATLLGNHFASNHVNTSDERLKENITPVEDVLPRLDDIRSVRFRFKDLGDGPSDYQLGLLAQEVQAEFPELVEERADGYRGVSYGHMTAVLLQAIKEQQALIESQQTQIDDLLRAFRNLPDSGGSPAVLPASPNGAGER
jgi:hypothetical protein